MKKILNEFKEFISKGNVIDLAVGMIIGSAFTAIVSSLSSSRLCLFIVVKTINAFRNIKKKEEKPAEPTTKICPYCMSEINIKAVKCPCCTSDLDK